MKKFLIILLLICAVLGLVLPAFARPASAKLVTNNASYNTISPQGTEDIDAYVEEQMHRLKMPGISLAIIEGNKIVHLRGFGQARPGGEAPSPHTPFILCSLTKSFTALAVMQLVEAGKVDLDAPIQRYLPWFRVAHPHPSAQITVRHLLNQTSGLTTSSGWIPLANFDNSPDATERQARAMASLKLTRPVGSAFEYSNSNYNLLGLIIEVASGESYPDYIQNHIFTPLDMSHSYTSQAIAKQNGLAVGHQYWFWFPFPLHNLPNPRGSLPSGQLISSSEDMAHYMIALLNGGHYKEVQILSDSGITQLHTGVAEDIKMGISMGKYGMGWYVSKIAQTKIAWHHGSAPDFASYMALLPEQNKGVVLLINADHFMMNLTVAEVGQGVATLLAGEQPAPIQLGFIPWVMRSLLLIPVIQIIGVVTTLRLLDYWRQNPDRRPSHVRKWVLYILLPLIPNLLLALTLTLMVGEMRGFWMLFMPDISWIAIICGGFALIWIFLRTGLILWTLQQPPSSKFLVQPDVYPS